MSEQASHRSHVLASPWPGIHGTAIESDRRYARHWHATYGVGVLEHGAQRSASGRGRVDAFAGDLITTNPGEVHDGHPLGGPTRRWRMLYLDPGAMAAMKGPAGSPLAGDVELARPVINDLPLRRALQRLFIRLAHWNAGRCTSGAGMLACEESLVAACGLLLERHASTAVVEESADLRPVRERLADEWLHPPTLSELAAMAGLSRYQLLRRFEKAYGVPPHAWLLQHRAERARRLIREGLGLADTAARCGFADQSHLHRVFARHFGFTPGAWQKAARRGAPQ